MCVTFNRYIFDSLYCVCVCVPFTLLYCYQTEPKWNAFSNGHIKRERELIELVCKVWCMMLTLCRKPNMIWLVIFGIFSAFTYWKITLLFRLMCVCGFWCIAFFYPRHLQQFTWCLFALWHFNKSTINEMLSAWSYIIWWKRKKKKRLRTSFTIKLPTHAHTHIIIRKVREWRKKKQ